MNFNFSPETLKAFTSTFALLAVLAVMAFVNFRIGAEVKAGNSEIDALNEKIVASIPKEEIERLIKINEEWERFYNEKTSLSTYEVWEFLSRVIPVSNGSERLEIKGPVIKVTYIDSDFKRQFALYNALTKLSAAGIVRSFEQSEVKAENLDPWTTQYSTEITLDATVSEQAVGAVRTESSTGTVSYVPVGSRPADDGFERLSKLRKFVEHFNPLMKEYLKFNR